MLIPSLKAAKSIEEQTTILEKGKQYGVNERFIRLSVINGLDACSALQGLQRFQRSLFKDIGKESNVSFQVKEMAEFLGMMQVWAQFCYPKQISQATRRTVRKRRADKSSSHYFELGDFIQSTRNRIKNELKEVKKIGVVAKIHSEELRWKEDTALWITFDTVHPLNSMLAVEPLLEVLSKAFRPDREMIVRIQLFSWFWKRIILVPLVQGKSLSRQVYANFDGATFTYNDESIPDHWRLVPEEVPGSFWSSLGIPEWDHHPSSNYFDQFAAAYVELFSHVDHLADFSRCDTEHLDEVGKDVFLRYFAVEELRARPGLQEVLDSCANLIEHLPELDESLIEARPDIAQCYNLFMEISSAILPCEGFEDETSMSIEEVKEWRNRLKNGLDLLGQIQALFLANLYGMDGYADEISDLI